MKNIEKNPPVIAEWFLRRMSYYEDTFSSIDNFNENYQSLLNNKGRFHAGIWYWLQTLLSARYYLSFLISKNFIMGRNYLKTAFRHLQRNKLNSFIGITGLSLGIACSIISFFIVYFEWSFDRFHEKGDRIFRIYEESHFANSPTVYTTHSHYPLRNFIIEHCPEVSFSVRYTERPVSIRYGEKSFNIYTGLADPEFFDIFSFHLISGDPSLAFSDPLSIILTSEFAQTCFGDEDPLGKTLLVENQLSLTVRGIMKDIPRNTHFKVNAIAPFALIGYPEDVDEFDWGGNSLATFVLLKEGVSFIEAGKKITSLLKQNNIDRIMHLQPVAEMNLYGLSGNESFYGLIIFSMISLTILLIACVNYTNLTVAGSALRTKEIGLRKVVGANKSDIIKQFMGETAILTLAAFVLGLAFVKVLQLIINNSGLYTFYFQDIEVLPGSIGILLILLLTGFVSGSYPSFIMSSLMPAITLKNSSFGSGGRPILRKILVTFQFVVVIFLFIGSTILYSQLEYMKNADLGYNKDNIVWSQLSGNRSSHYQSIKEDLMKYPEIQRVSWGSESPAYVGSNVWAVDWDGKDPEKKITFNFQYVDFDYIKTFKMKIIEGRDFSEQYSTDRTEAYIINESAVKIIGLNDPIGKRLSVFGNGGRIIGVVKDFNFQPLRNEIAPFVIAIGDDQWRHHIFIRVDPESSNEAMDIINNVFEKFDPDKSTEFYFFNDLISYSYRMEERMISLAGYLTFMLIFIASLGLFGMISFTSQQRTREIGIRKALGASSVQLLIMLNRNLLSWILMSNIIAWPLAYWAVNRIFENYAYHIGMNPLYFILSGLSALLIGLMTVILKTIKTVNVNPVNTLKYE